jgi:hypothetical protein
MSAHTPGPWVIKGISMDTGSISIGPEDLRIVIAYVTNAASFGDFVNATLAGRRDFGAPDTANTQQANACLIAAAPDLYEYVESSASAGCATAKKLMERINGHS